MIVDRCPVTWPRLWVEIADARRYDPTGAFTRRA